MIEIEKLVVGGSDLGESRFVVDGILEVGANAFELRNPGEDWIGLRGILHVTHGEAEGVEVVLDAKELKGVTAVTVDEVALHFVDADELECDVTGVGEDGKDGADTTSSTTQCRVEATVDGLNIRSAPALNPNNVVGELNIGDQADAQKVEQNGFRKLDEGRWVSSEYVEIVEGRDC